MLGTWPRLFFIEETGPANEGNKDLWCVFAHLCGRMTESTRTGIAEHAKRSAGGHNARTDLGHLDLLVLQIPFLGFSWVSDNPDTNDHQASEVRDRTCNWISRAGRGRKPGGVIGPVLVYPNWMAGKPPFYIGPCVALDRYRPRWHKSRDRAVARFAV